MDDEMYIMDGLG